MNLKTKNEENPTNKQKAQSNTLSQYTVVNSRLCDIKKHYRYITILHLASDWFYVTQESKVLLWICSSIASDM